MKQFRRTFTFDGTRYDIKANSQEELAVKVAMRKKELEEGKVRITGTMTVKAWSEEWLAAYKEGVVGDAWLDTLRRNIKNHITPHIGKLPLRQVKQLHIQKMLMTYKNLSNSSIDKIYTQLNEMFEVARKNKLILENPVEGAQVPSGKKEKSRRALTPVEREAIITAAEKYRGGPFFLCSLYCGLRPGEVAGLKWNCIDLNKGILKVELSLKSEGNIGSPKSKAGIRTVPIPNDFARVLKELKKGTAPFDFVFTQASGNRHTKTSIRQMWKSLVRIVNIDMGCEVFREEVLPPYRLDENLTPYYLRHTYCTDLQAAGVPIDIARRLMGHANISTTSRIYTHDSQEAFDAASDALNNLHTVRKEKRIL